MRSNFGTKRTVADKSHSMEKQFNSVGQSSGSGSNLIPSLSSHPQQQQPQQLSQQSPMIKASTLKTVKSTMINQHHSSSQHQAQPTYILPATTQSRTLQNQHQKQKQHHQSSNNNNYQSTAGQKSTPNGLLNYVTNNGSKSVSNIQVAGSAGNFIHSNNKHHNLSSQDGSGNKINTSNTAVNGYGLRPESGNKKRTSFLLQQQQQQQQHAQHHSTSSGNINATASHVQQQNQNLNDKNQPAKKNHGISEGLNTVIVTSPAKRIVQGHKPSGKSTKSNRTAALVTKKTLVPGHSSSIYPPSLNTQQQLHTNSQLQLLSSHNHNSHHQNHQQQPLISPMLNHNSKNNINNNNKDDQGDNSRHSVILQQNSSNKLTAPGGRGKQQQVHLSSSSQGRYQVGSTSGYNSKQEQHQSSYLVNKNQIDFRKNSLSQAALKTNKNDHQTNNGSSTAVGATGLNAYQTVTLGKQPENSQRPGNLGYSSTLAHVGSKSSQSLGEQGAVAAVIPSSNAPANQIQTTSLGNEKNTVSNSQGNRAHASSQKFLPTIQSTSSTATGHSHAMYAATSPYHSIEEQNIPLQPLSSNPQFHHPGQATAHDYFNLKQAQTVKVGSAGPSAIRSTSQPHTQSHLSSAKQNPMNASQPQLQPSGNNTNIMPANGGGSQNVTSQQNSAAPAQHHPHHHHGTAASQMQNILNKGLRSSSEPAQPQLKQSDSTASFMENMRQRTAFTVVMKAMAPPKQPKSSAPRQGTEAQLASEHVKATVAKLLQKNQPSTTLPFFQTSKISSKAFGMVRAFAANTNVGIVRKANEDRISIILNVIQPAQKSPRIPADKWPKLQIFGVYDGHGGSRCAEYLKDNLHNNIILQPEFPADIPEAIRTGSLQTEEDYLRLVCPSPDQPHNKAGSCAIVILIVNEDVYILNVGDSRALGSISEHPSDSMIQTKASQALNQQPLEQTLKTFSMEATSQAKPLSRDHKPSDPLEFARITKAGGYIYQTQTVMKSGLPTTQTQQVRQETVPPPEDSEDEENPFVGPYRVFPGRLSVCRTFGDCEAKLAHLGGMKGVVTCDPETTHEQGGVNYLDYALIASDGVFDKLTNDQINKIVWDVTTKARLHAHSLRQVPSIHTISGQVADEILHASARYRSLDNLSIVFVAFQRFKDYIEMFKQEVTQPTSTIINKPTNLQPISSYEPDSSQKSNIAPHSALNRTPQRNLNHKVPANLPTSNYQKPDEVAKENSLPKSTTHAVDAKPLQKNSQSMYMLEPSASHHPVPQSHGILLMSSQQSKSQSLQNLQVQQHDKKGEGEAAPVTGQQYQQVYQGANNKGMRHSQNDQMASNNNQHRPASMLEGITNQRPSSRNDGGATGSRKGTRNGRKVGVAGGANSSSAVGTTGTKQTAAVGVSSNSQVVGSSHSQDSRPVLPKVSMQKGTANQSVVANQGKLAYSNTASNLLADQKGNTNSSSTSALPTQSSVYQQSSTNNTGNRDQQNSAQQNSRRGALFKVNPHNVVKATVNSHQGHSNSGSTSIGNHNSNNSNNNFIPPQASTKSVLLPNSHSQVVNGSGPTITGNKLILNDQNAIGQMNNANANRINSNNNNLRKKMKPYKSNQTRRMPDSQTTAGMKASSSMQYMDVGNQGTQQSSSSQHHHQLTGGAPGARRDGSSFSEHAQSQGGNSSLNTKF